MAEGEQEEVILKDDPHRPVVRVGNTVRRPTGWWTPAVHQLLAHLEAVGFRYAPRVLGTDERGREVLSFIEGVAGADSWSRVVSERGLERFARLLREYHDAVAGFVPSPNIEWATRSGPPAPGEVICHGDFGPWNVVWRGEEPVGLLDWDFAYPGAPMDDIAYALAYSIPFRDDEMCLQWLRYEAPPDRKRRLTVFAAAYGLSSTAGLVDRVVERQLLDITNVEILARRGLEPQKSWVASGMLEELRERAAWSRRHRDLFE
jgi:aminoglycoside phosphotransferase (APT) family kinase protein